MGDEKWISCGLNKEETNPKNGPSLRDSNEAMGSASSDNILDLNDLFVQEDDRCQVSDGAGKKKKAARIVGWGLRKFSMIVCRKVEAKGRTTYNEVADEIIADLASLDKNVAPHFVFDEKNIRRRVYDAFNVLMAINVIEKDKKAIKWVGFPTTRTSAMKELKKIYCDIIDNFKPKDSHHLDLDCMLFFEKVQMDIMHRVEAKASFLKELEEKFVDLRNIMLRNQQLHTARNIHSEGVALPFMLVRTHPQATVEIEISEDKRFVHFDFNGTPFTLHDDAAILKAMRHPQSEPKQATEVSADAATLIANCSSNLLEQASLSWSSVN